MHLLHRDCSAPRSEGRTSFPLQAELRPGPSVTRGGRASSWVPNPLWPQRTRWMLLFPKCSHYLVRLPPTEGVKCSSRMCHAAEQRLPVTPPVPSSSRHSVAASQDAPCIRHGLGWDQSTVSWDGSKELAGETGEHEGCQLGSKAGGKEAAGHYGTGDRDSRGRVKVRPCIQASGEHAWGKIQPGVPHGCLC